MLSSPGATFSKFLLMEVASSSLVMERLERIEFLEEGQKILGNFPLRVCREETCCRG